MLRNIQVKSGTILQKLPYAGASILIRVGALEQLHLLLTLVTTVFPTETKKDRVCVADRTKDRQSLRCALRQLLRSSQIPTLLFLLRLLLNPACLQNRVRQPCRPRPHQSRPLHPRPRHRYHPYYCRLKNFRPPPPSPPTTKGGQRLDHTTKNEACFVRQLLYHCRGDRGKPARCTAPALLQVSVPRVLQCYSSRE